MRQYILDKKSKEGYNGNELIGKPERRDAVDLLGAAKEELRKYICAKYICFK